MHIAQSFTRTLVLVAITLIPESNCCLNEPFQVVYHPAPTAPSSQKGADPMTLDDAPPNKNDLLEDSYSKYDKAMDMSLGHKLTCGENKYRLYGSRILRGVGITYGNSALPHQFPWLVRLETSLAGRCNGVIIDKHFVLTAAFCVAGISPSGVTVHFGDIRSDIYDDGEITKVPRNVYIHPKYNMTSASYNFALLRFEYPIDLSQLNVQKICLPSSCVDMECYPGARGLVAGWGRIETDEFADNIKTVDMPIIHKQECIANWKSMNQQDFVSGEDIMCAGVLQGPSMYWNDDGAPLMVRNRKRIYKACGIHGMFRHNRQDQGMLLYSTFSNICYANEWIAEIKELIC